MAPEEQPFEAITSALKKATAALRDAGIDFVVGGSLASWARGGAETRKDLDLIVKPEDAEGGLAALGEVGMRTERPPEGWLVKAWEGDTLIDIISSPTGVAADDELISRGETLETLGFPIPAMALEDLITTKLFALSEHSLDYGPVLQIARALRERIDWDAVRERTRETPFSRPFFVLLEELRVLEEAPQA